MEKKISMKALAEELDGLRSRVMKLEKTLESAISPAVERIRHLLSSKERKAEQERRQQMIQETAYFLAEKRGFLGGSPEQDWREAERLVDEQLKRSKE